MVRGRGRGKVSEDQQNRTDNLGLSTETLPHPGLHLWCLVYFIHVHGSSTRDGSR